MAKGPTGVCVIEAPCKINLHLSIGEKRNDGFHNLQSIFVPLALADTLRFECCSAGEDTLSVNYLLTDSWRLSSSQSTHCQISAKLEENLVLRAVSLFRRRIGFESALRIRLDKRIPASAGLGGGSSDAASALLALNVLAGGPFSAHELLEMAAVLGSDVPFFLSGGAAFVSGRGERVEPIKTPEGLWALLVKPPFSSDTANSYRILDEARERPVQEKLPQEKLSSEALIRALQSPPQTWPFYNDFLPVFLAQGGKKAAAYRTILDDLRNAGASFAGLSGSGSCCFGIFTSEKTARNAENALSCTKNDINLTFFLAQKPNGVVKY